MLYAATNNRLPLRPWDKENRALCVEPLKESETTVARYFTLPVVQYVGSDTCCGCGFPNQSLIGDQWTGDPDSEEPDPDGMGNLHALAKLIEESGENSIELYGIWLSKDEDFKKELIGVEAISFETILRPTFQFKERYLYKVNLANPATSELAAKS